MIYIFWTCSNKDEAKRIISDLLKKRLIACASIFPVESMFTWKGKVEEASEIKVFLKTVSKHFEAIQAYIQESASYEVSEIAGIDASKVDPNYLSWVMQET